MVGISSSPPATPISADADADAQPGREPSGHLRPCRQIELWDGSGVVGGKRNRDQHQQRGDDAVQSR